MMGKTAGIIIIGNEVLSGKVADTNSPYLCRELRALGVDVRRISVIPDDVEIIAAEVGKLAPACDAVVTTGGVGPTHDDVTIEGIARAFGCPVVRHPRLEEILQNYYRAALEPAQLKMAEVPEGAALVGGDALRFPVVVVRNVYIFPGIPEILREKFDAIKGVFRDAPFHLHTVYLNAPEDAVAPHLNATLGAYPRLLLGSYPLLNHPDYTVRVTLESKDEAYVKAALRHLLDRLPGGVVVKLE